MPPASFWWVASTPWLPRVVEASPQSLPLSSQSVLPVGMSVSKLPVVVNTLVISGQALPNELILT